MIKLPNYSLIGLPSLQSISHTHSATEWNFGLERDHLEIYVGTSKVCVVTIVTSLVTMVTPNKSQEYYIILFIYIGA